MTETYAFFAMYAIQILAMSVLYPARFIRYLRLQATSIPAERLAQLYPGVDLGLARDRFVTRYRALNTGIAVLGLLLLGWLCSYMQRPERDELRVVVPLICVYFLVQALLPLGLVIFHGVRVGKLRKRSLLLEGERKAVLQRRGLFDFVSPFAVFVAAAGYLLFAAFVIRHPFPGFAGFVSLGAVTLAYAVQAFVVYAVLYGKKPNPFETHAGRVQTIGLVVKSCVYSCIACVAFVSLSFTLGLLDWQRWEPFALSAFFVISALLSLLGMTAPPHQPGADDLDSGGRAAPEPRNLSV